MVNPVLANPAVQQFALNGAPINGGKLFTYAAGTTTKQASYTDATGNTQNTNPILLNAQGQPQTGAGQTCGVWLDPSLSYKLVLAPATDTDPPTNAYWTVDNVSGPTPASFTQSGTGATTRSLSGKVGEVVSVKDYGALGNNTTDDTAAIQACFDANPNGLIVFPAGTYKVSATIVLVNASGRNFQGSVLGFGATVNFTNAGAAADADSAMQRGFAAYPVTNGAGGDITGLRGAKFAGLNITGPTHGAGIYIANSQGVIFDNVTTKTSRYGIVEECCINVNHLNCTFNDYTNAGVGLLMLSDTARVWYGSGSPTTSYWNDGVLFTNCGFKNALTTQPLAHILDHGSMAEANRIVEGGYLFSAYSGSGPFTSTQYGILSRNGNWTLRRAWFENISYPIRLLEAAAVEGTGNVTAVAGAEPSGTYALTNFPDGYCYNFRAEGLWFARGFQDINLSGVRGVARLSGNISQFLQNGGQHIKSISTSAAQIVIDDVAQVLFPVGSYSYSSFVSGNYVSDSNILTSWTPTVTASSGAITAYTVNAAKYQQRGKWVEGHFDITITTNGTGAGALQVSPPVTAKVQGGSLCGREDAVSSKGLQGKCDGAQLSVWNYDGTYPAASGARLVCSFSYEAA